MSALVLRSPSHAQIISGTQDGDAVPVKVVFDSPKGVRHARGPLNNQTVRYINANIKYSKNTPYPEQDKFILQPLNIDFPKHTVSFTTQNRGKITSSKLDLPETTSAVSISSFGDSWPITWLISDMAKQEERNELKVGDSTNCFLGAVIRIPRR